MNKQTHIIDHIKRQAKTIKKEQNITHTEALEFLAKQAGYSNWTHCRRVLNKEAVAEIKSAVIQGEITFTEWLTKHKNRNSPLGDLASDMLRDPNWPAHYNAVEQFTGYLDAKRVYFEATRTLKEAWKTYQLYLRRRDNPTSVKPRIKKTISEQADTRRIVYVKNVKSLHYLGRTIEKFNVSDKAWVSWNGSKAIPVTILEVDDRHYTFRKERPIKDAKDSYYLFLDEVHSTPELACLNRVTN